MSIPRNSVIDFNTVLSQLLEVRRHQQHPTWGMKFLPVINSASGSDITDSLSPPPPQINHAAKSFTIDAILGLRCKSTPVSAVLDYSTSPSSKNHGINKHETSASKSSNKSKRIRTIFTPEQLERLEAEFERQQYMVGTERLYLAHTLQLSEAQVKVWFQNRRIKWRKQHLEMTHQRLAILKQHKQENTILESIHSEPQIESTENEVDFLSDKHRL